MEKFLDMCFCPEAMLLQNHSSPLLDKRGYGSFDFMRRAEGPERVSTLFIGILTPEVPSSCANRRSWSNNQAANVT
jgi:hypothetical protein